MRWLEMSPRPLVPRAVVTTLILSLVLLLLLPAVADAGRKEKKLIEALPERYQRWLESVEQLITDEEVATFLELEKDYQRDAFIEEFWKIRDPYPRTGRNELREAFQARTEQAVEVFGTMEDHRSRIYLMNGPPETRLEIDCSPSLWPLEVWRYKGSDLFRMEFLLLFYQDGGRGIFKLWEPFFGFDVLQTHSAGVTRITPVTGGLLADCGQEGDAVRAAMGFLRAQGGQLGASVFLDELQRPKEPPPDEWVATFETYSTDLPEGAETFDATLLVDYPGRHQSRSILQGAVAVPVAAVERAELGTHAAYNLVLIGEILQDGSLFESFRYKYDFPAAEVTGEQLPLVFQRYLRPGPYQLVVKVEDVNAGSFFRAERDVEVPHLEQAPPPEPADPETARLLEEANAAIRTGENTLQIIPLHGEWQTGLVRVDTLITGDDFAKVTFFLDGQPILTKKSPPYNVELDLGDVPRGRSLRVEGYDAAGEEIAWDEEVLNAGQHRFAVRLVEPRQHKSYQRSLRAQAEVQVPEGEVVDRVEFFLNEDPVATVYQPPYVQPIVLPQAGQVAYVRAVAYTPDGLSTEDTVFINSPGTLEEIDVDFVELYTAVLDRDQRPVEGLTEEDFTVLEDGVPQEIVRFEQVRNLPIHAAVMLDVSASMEEELGQTQTAALRFFEQAVTPKDRAAIVTFNDHPRLAAKFTNEVEELAGGLAGLQAERGTALYDSLVFTLYYFNGIRGQRAILLLSDGRDESSRFEFEDALEYARRAGVAIYAIGLDLPRTDFDVRRKLTKLAEETGGRSFYIGDVEELAGIYDTIQRELRSRYLLAYQSSNTSDSRTFRSIEVTVDRPGVEAKTLRGYYP